MSYRFELILFSESVCLFQPKNILNTLSEAQALQIKNTEFIITDEEKHKESKEDLGIKSSLYETLRSYLLPF